MSIDRNTVQPASRDRMRIEPNLLAGPSRRMLGEALLQWHTAVVGATRLRDLRSLFADRLQCLSRLPAGDFSMRLLLTQRREGN